MSFRTTLIVAIIFVAALGGYLAFKFAYKGEEKSEYVDIEEAYNLQRDQIVKIRLSYSDEELQPITLERRGEEWFLTEPVEAPADPDKVKYLLDDLLDKRVKMRFKAEDLAKYGLERPQIVVSVWTSASKEPYREFLIGSKAIEYSVYAKERSDPDVIAIESSALDDFTKTASDLRLRKIMRFALKEARSLTLSYPGRPAIKLSKDEEGKWRMLEPVETDADQDAVKEVLEELRDLRVAVFEDDSPKSLAKYGLERPRAKIEIEYDGKAKKLLIGSKDERTGRVYVKLASQPFVYSVEPDDVDGLFKKPLDLRDKTVMAFQRFETDRIEIIRGGERLVCRRKGEGKWEIVEPVKVEADETAVDDLLFSLDSLKAKKFVSEKAENLERFGLKPPKLEIKVQEAGKPDIYFVKLGSKTEEGVYALGSRLSAVVLISDSDFEKLDVTLLDLRTKQVWDIETSEVVELELKHNGTEIKCLRKGYDWHIVSPVKEKARNVAVGDMVYKVHDLKALRFVKGRKPLSELGLDKPRLVLKLKTRDGKTYELKLGKEAEEGIYAKATGVEATFTVGEDVLDELKKTLEDLREK